MVTIGPDGGDACSSARGEEDAFAERASAALAVGTMIVVRCLRASST
jgi:hypothetical protein